MAVDITDLAKHLGFANPPSDDEAMQRCLDAAEIVIAPHLVVEDYIDNPAYEMSLLTMAADFWRQKDAPRGIYGFADGSDYYSVNALPRNLLPAVWPWLANAGLVNPTVVA